ncbi:MAG TPA: DUF6356 family protein [Patescibacteria group bacterium]|nr:DUF6356 family protein [Patescibacteria group bacterium]
MSNSEMKKNLGRILAAAFTDHPREAGETYWQHFMFTCGMAWRLFVICLLLLGHGILPFTLTHAASHRLQKCQRILADRAQRTGYNEMCDGFGI